MIIPLDISRHQTLDRKRKKAGQLAKSSKGETVDTKTSGEPEHPLALEFWSRVEGFEYTKLMQDVSHQQGFYNQASADEQLVRLSTSHCFRFRA